MRVLVFAPVLLLLFSVLPVWLSTRQAMPTIAAAAAVIAVTSVTVTAVSSYASWARARSQATLEAWSAWADGSLEDRRAISAVIGRNQGMTAEIGEALCEGRGFRVVREGVPRTVGEEESRRLRSRVRKVLAGLERLSVGVEQSVYDRDALMQIGGTVLVATYARYRAYIARLQQHPNESLRRPRAYTALSALVREVESEAGTSRRRLFDEARLRRIRRTIGEDVENEWGGGAE